jgi:uncharacterized protein YndB with AHSA1/START domain
MMQAMMNEGTMTNPIESTRSVVIERIFPYPPEKLWRALTESPLLAQWLLSNDFEPVAGRRFQFRNEPVPGWNGVIDCEVQVVDPMRELAYSWGSMGLVTVVHWTLTPAAGGTLVRMEQSGFGADQEFAYKGATYGWKRFLGELEKVLDGGVL